MELWRYCQEGKEHPCLHRLLLRMVRNCAYDLNQKDRAVLSLDDPKVAHRAEQAAASREEMRELDPKIVKCLEEISDEDRSLILMHHVEKIDTATIADRLGINPGAVRTRLFRARQSIHRCVNGGNK